MHSHGANTSIVRVHPDVLDLSVRENAGVFAILAHRANERHKSRLRILHYLFDTSIVIFEPILLDIILFANVRKAVHFEGQLYAMNAVAIMAHRQSLRLREFLLNVAH